jgi:hypothetical protein
MKDSEYRLIKELKETVAKLQKEVAASNTAMSKKMDAVDTKVDSLSVQSQQIYDKVSTASATTK